MIVNKSGLFYTGFKKNLRIRRRQILSLTGFTLIEIVTVITIIIILIGLLSPVINKARQQARIQKAKAMIGSLEVAINMYYTDLGEYPEGLNTLIDPPEDYGPYMDNKDFEEGEFKDPWGAAYEYTQPGTHNPRIFDVWSSGSGDDIGNW